MSRVRGMFQSLPLQAWIILGLIYLALCVHTALSMRRYGRRFWPWLLISVCTTPLSAAIVSSIDYFGALRRRLDPRRAEDAEEVDDEAQAPGSHVRRCEHCGEVLTGRQLPRAGGKVLCPRCRMVVQEDNLA